MRTLRKAWSAHGRDPSSWDPGRQSAGSAQATEAGLAMVGREGVSGQTSISWGRMGQEQGEGTVWEGFKGGPVSPFVCFFSSYVSRGVSQEWWSGSTTQEEEWPRRPGHLLGRGGDG